MSNRPADYRGMWISVYRPISGWKAICYWWNPDMGGFWEPWQTGDSAWKTQLAAVIDAKTWAEADDLPYYES